MKPGMSQKNRDYASNDQEILVLTDEFRTRDIVWEFYYGFLENWRVYMIRRARGKDAEIARLGVISYAEILIGELSVFIREFEAELIERKYDVERFNELSKIEPDQDKFLAYEDSDFTFLRDFINGFMKISGWKNIIRKGEDKSPAAVKRYDEG